MAKTPPTVRQLEVRQWIADGCPAGVMTDPTFKVSAYALDRRNLVRVKRRKNPWIAELTVTGKELLSSCGADALAPAELPVAAAPQAPSPAASSPDGPPMPASARVPAAPAKSATQEMMDRLSVERRIEFPDAETGRYRRLVTVARRKNLFPDDMELVVSTNWNKPCTVELRRRPEWQLVALDAVDVPERVRRLMQSWPRSCSRGQTVLAWTRHDGTGHFVLFKDLPLKVRNAAIWWKRPPHRDRAYMAT
jgi:hypothetical protein